MLALYSLEVILCIEESLKEVLVLIGQLLNLVIWYLESLLLGWLRVRLGILG